MGIFDFLKKIVKKNKVEEIVIEKLVFSEIEGWIERKIRENEIKEKEILFVVGEKIRDFIKELREKIVILEGFDVEARKDKDNIKKIVTNSREKYIESVEDLIERLNNLEEPKLEKFIEKTNKIFFNFNKSSFKNYEMTTILIGKEMAAIRNSLKTFSKKLVEIFNENKNIVDLSRSIVFIRLKLNQLNQIDKVLGEIKGEIAFIEKKTIDKKEEEEKLLEEIEKTKKSTSYLDYLNMQEKIKFLEEEIKKDIQGLKQLIDFKALTNFYHIFENEMNAIKEHRENFEESFRKDDGLRILNLLENSKLKNNEISEKEEHIRIRKEELKKNKQEIKGDETQNLNSEKTRIGNEIEELNTEKVKEEKRYDKLKTSKRELISILKQEIGRMNVEVI